MREARSGRIVNISSSSAIQSPPLMAPYATTKMAVEGISTNIALHQELMHDAAFIKGGASIHYLEQKLAARQALAKDKHVVWKVMAVVGLMQTIYGASAGTGCPAGRPGARARLPVAM